MRSLGASLFRLGWVITPLGAVITIVGLVWALNSQPGGVAEPELLGLAEQLWLGGLWISIGGFLMTLSGSAIADSPRPNPPGEVNSKSLPLHSRINPKARDRASRGAGRSGSAASAESQRTSSRGAAR